MTQTYWRITYRVTPPGKDPFIMVLKSLPGSKTQAAYKGRKLLRAMFPSCGIRRKRTLRDRKAEAKGGTA